MTKQDKKLYREIQKILDEIPLMNKKIPKPKFIKEYAKRIPTEDVYFNIYKQARKDLVEEIKRELPKERHQTIIEWWCDIHSFFGNEGEYCKHCRKKLVKRVDTWEEDDDMAFNQALKQVQEILNKLL